MELFEASDILKMQAPDKETKIHIKKTDKCRMCIKPIKNKVLISPAVHRRFQDVTQLDLSLSDKFSKFICSKCDKELRDVHSYRERLIFNQRKLAEEVGEEITETGRIFEPELVTFVDDTVEFKQEKQEVEAVEIIESFDDHFGGDDCSDQNDADYMPLNEDKSRLDEENSRLDEQNGEIIVDKVFNKKCIRKRRQKPLGGKTGRIRTKWERSRDEIEVLKKAPIKEKTIQDESGRTLFVCDFCGKPITSSFSLKEHILTQHTALEKKYPCPMEGCGLSYVTSSRLRIHLQTHKDDKKAVCQICGAILTNRKCLREHVAAVHGNPNRFKCDLCSYTASIKARIRSHVIVHIQRENRMNNACHICGFVSVCPKSLKRHLFEHRGIEFRCHCGKTFNYKGALQMHIRCVHKKVKPHVCETCEKPFFNKQDLVNHVLLKHNPEKVVKSFPCDVCGKLYALPKQLERHRLYHHLRFDCTYVGCGEYFNTQKRLERHMKSHES